MPRPRKKTAEPKTKPQAKRKRKKKQEEVPEEERAERDPLEMFDMSAELEDLRRLLQERGYQRAASSADGEVWIEQARKFRATLLSDINRRLRLEIRNPDGSIRTEINPAWPVDVEAALPR